MNPTNVGAFYTVLEPCQCHAMAWYVEPKQDVLEDVSLMGRFTRVCRAGSWCCAWDRELRPIRPPGTTQAKPTVKELEHS